MPPMATSSAKRKWSDVFDDGDVFDKQSLMDLCTSKLRYVNPARPPRRRTEVPLLRNVLIVNTMKHLSTDLRLDNPIDYNAEDLSVDPGHFEGLPPLSELLTDIMLDPQSNEQQQWTTPTTVDAVYASLTPLEPTIPSYLEASDAPMDGGDECKVVHDLLPCTSVISMDSSRHLSWDSSNTESATATSWTVESSPVHSVQTWGTSDSSVLDCFLPTSSSLRSSHNTHDVTCSEPDSSFQSPSGPLPSFTSLFEPPAQQSTFTELLQSPTDSTSHPSSYFPYTSSFPAMHGTSTDDLVGNVNLSEADLELLAMTVSSKLPPHMSFEDLVHALPQSSQPSQTFYVPSHSLQSNNSSGCESTPTANGQCASYCRKDQPQTSVDDGSMVRVLVNL